MRLAGSLPLFVLRRRKESESDECIREREGGRDSLM